MSAHQLARPRAEGTHMSVRTTIIDDKAQIFVRLFAEAGGEVTTTLLPVAKEDLLVNLAKPVEDYHAWVESLLPPEGQVVDAMVIREQQREARQQERQVVAEARRVEREQAMAARTADRLAARGGPERL